jgi:ATP-binding cassette subfamily C protein
MTSFLEFLRFLWRAMRWKLVFAVALSLVLSLTEGAGLALMFPLIALLGGATRAGWAFHLLTRSGLPERVWLPTVMVALLASVGALNSLTAALNALEMDIILRVRETTASMLYRAMLRADWGFVAKRRSAGLTHLLTGELHRMGTLGGGIATVLGNAMLAALMLGVAAYLSPVLTLVVVAAFAALVPWQQRVGRDMFTAGQKISAMSEEVANSSVERLQHLKVIKAYGTQEAELRVFDARLQVLTKEMTAMEWRATGASRGFQLISMGVMCGVILLGLGPLHLSPAAMLVFLFAFLRTSPRVGFLQGKVNSMLVDLPAFGRIQTFLAECRLHEEEAGRNEIAPELTRELKVCAVQFSYGATEILRGLDLTLRAGEITALAGVSGAGKSTLADLLMGLLVANAGTIEVDGVALTRANVRSWRHRVGYVSQDTLLFHETIRQNLLWARPEATESELAEAIEAANAQFCYKLPMGLETVAGDRGTMLSHGQRQRIALARAFLLRPALLILDEATNSLDGENEAAILTTVKARAGLTTLLISHRPSALAFGDVVYQMEGGVIVAAQDFERK